MERLIKILEINNKDLLTKNIRIEKLQAVRCGLL